MTCNCKSKCNRCRCDAAESERLKADALTLLETRREAVIRRGQRALLDTLLCSGVATADDVRDLVELPPGIGPKCFGAVPPPLARAGIIRANGFSKTCRPTAHARPLTVWILADRDAAVRWLRNHPDLPDPIDQSEGAAGSQRVLFPFTQETATPTGIAAGAAL